MKIARPHALIGSLKALAICALATITLSTALPDLQARPSRDTQEKKEPSAQRPSSHTRNSTRSTAPSKPQTTAPSDRNSNRSQPPPPAQTQTRSQPRQAPPPQVQPPRSQPRPTYGHTAPSGQPPSQAPRVSRPTVRQDNRGGNRDRSERVANSNNNSGQNRHGSSTSRSSTNRVQQTGPSTSTNRIVNRTGSSRNEVATVRPTTPRPLPQTNTRYTLPDRRNRSDNTANNDTRRDRNSDRDRDRNRDNDHRHDHSNQAGDDHNHRNRDYANNDSRSRRTGDRDDRRDRGDRHNSHDRTFYDNDRDHARNVYVSRRNNVYTNISVRHDRIRNRSIRDDHDHRISRHTHRHGHGCGHHYYDGRWHDFSRSHRHFAGCGHNLVSGVWVTFSLGHSHGIGCGHFFENGVWLTYSGSRHRHHIGCGHYFWDGYWHNSPCYHIHGPNCGHHYHNGRWHDFHSSHVHHEHCGHVYDGTTWLIVESSDHIHGNECGHHYFEGNWYRYPRDYYTMNREDSLYFFVDLGSYQNRNFPQWAYQDWLSDGYPRDIFRSSEPLAKAYAAFAQGRYYDSIMDFKRAVNKDPENGLVYLARAQAYIAIKDYRAAYDDLIRGMQLIPEWADVRLTLSEIYSNSNDLAEHTQQLEDWVERFPRDFKAHFVLGYFYYFHQEYDAAKNELLYALSWDDNLEPAHNLMDHILAFEAESEVLTTEEIPDPNELPEVTQE